MRGRTLQILCYWKEAKTLPFFFLFMKRYYYLHHAPFSVPSMGIGTTKPAGTTVSIYFNVVILEHGVMSRVKEQNHSHFHISSYSRNHKSRKIITTLSAGDHLFQALHMLWPSNKSILKGVRFNKKIELWQNPNEILIRWGLFFCILWLIKSYCKLYYFYFL